MSARFDVDGRCSRHRETACPSCFAYENTELRTLNASLVEALREVQADIRNAEVNNVVWPNTQRMIAEALSRVSPVRDE